MTYTYVKPSSIVCASGHYSVVMCCIPQSPYLQGLSVDCSFHCASIHPRRERVPQYTESLTNTQSLTDRSTHAVHTTTQSHSLIHSHLIQRVSECSIQAQCHMSQEKAKKGIPWDVLNFKPLSLFWYLHIQMLCGVVHIVS